MSIVIRNLTKYYAATKAVDNLSFKIAPGEIVGLLGPNGAGKTTTVRMITGYLTPSAGSIEVRGVNVATHPKYVRRMIGYLAEDNPLYPDLNLIEYLEFIATLQKMRQSSIRSRVIEVIRMFGLEQVKHINIGQLSKGFRQRVGLAATMIHDPQVLIYDEPTIGLDPNQILAFREFVKSLRGKKSVLISTHTLAEVEALCSRVIIIAKGKVLADAPMSQLKEKYRAREEFYVEIETTDSWTQNTVQRKLESLKNVQAVVQLSGESGTERSKAFLIHSDKDSDIRREVFRLCIDEGWTLVDLHRSTVPIGDVFHLLTTGGTG